MQLRVALVDRGAVGGEELRAGNLASLEQPARFFGSQSQGVDHAGGTRK
jgi:hypothetical protein